MTASLDSEVGHDVVCKFSLAQKTKCLRNDLSNWRKKRKKYLSDILNLHQFSLCQIIVSFPEQKWTEGLTQV